MSGTRTTSDSNDTPRASTVADASDVIAALLAREDGELGDEQQAEEETAKGNEPEGDDQPTAKDETQGEPEEGDAGTEEEGADDEGQEPEEPDPVSTLVTVEIDGKAEKLSLEEVTKGYLRQADYTRKTTVLAQERKTFYGEVAGLREERAQYAALLPALAQQLQGAATQEPDWDRLAQEDPVEFNRLWASKQIRDRKLAAVQAEQQRQDALAARETQQQHTEMLKAAREELPRLNSAWADPARWKADRDATKVYLSGIGYSDEQIAALADPKAVLIANKARLYDEAMKRGVEPAKPRAQAPQRPAPQAAARPGPAQRPTVTDHTRAKMRLAKTHDVRDAAKVIEGLI